MEIISEPSESVLKIYKTPIYCRIAVSRYEQKNRQIIKEKHLIKRQNPEYVLHLQSLSREYRLRQKLKKELLKNDIKIN